MAKTFIRDFKEVFSVQSFINLTFKGRISFYLLLNLHIIVFRCCVENIFYFGTYPKPYKSYLIYHISSAVASLGNPSNNGIVYIIENNIVHGIKLVYPVNDPGYL